MHHQPLNLKNIMVQFWVLHKMSLIKLTWKNGPYSMEHCNYITIVTRWVFQKLIFFFLCQSSAIIYWYVEVWQDPCQDEDDMAGSSSWNRVNKNNMPDEATIHAILSLMNEHMRLWAGLVLSSLNGWALLLKISGVLWVDDYSISVLKPAWAHLRNQHQVASSLCDVWERQWLCDL